MERRLAAILSADVVGYSRLMGVDEEGTLRDLNACRQIFFNHITAGKGRVVNAPGDAILAEFVSAVEAASAAIAIQRELATRNADIPESRRMRFRIGVNLGDVIAEGEDIYGDGVNIAARLESLSKPGGICVSAKVYEELQHRLTANFRYLGKQSVKNIARPVGAYHIVDKAIEANSAPASTQTTPSFTVESRYKPSIAVLPFSNMSADPEQDYFSDGLSDDIITDLSKFSNLDVIARNSTFTYKGRTVSVQTVAAEMGVEFVLEGSVRRSGDRLRVTAQLINGKTGHHVWAQRFDRDLGEMFELQDEITEEIVSALNIRLIEGEQGLRRKLLRTPAARDELYQGIAQLNRMTRESVSNARRHFERVTELEPDSPEGYSRLGWAYLNYAVRGWSSDPAGDLARVQELALEVLARDPNSADGHALMGNVCLHRGEFDEAIAASERAVELFPGAAVFKVLLAHVYANTGAPERAIQLVKQAMALSPVYSDWFLAVLSQAYCGAGEFENGLESASELVSRNPDSLDGHVLLTYAYGALERPDEAKTAAKEVLRIHPGYTITGNLRRRSIRDPVTANRVTSLLRQAGLPE